MIMPARIRKVALTAHIPSTLSWLGAIAGFLALAIVLHASAAIVALLVNAVLSV